MTLSLNIESQYDDLKNKTLPCASNKSIVRAHIVAWVLLTLYLAGSNIYYWRDIINHMVS